MMKLIRRFSWELVLLLVVLLSLNTAVVGLVYGAPPIDPPGGNPHVSPSPSASVDPSASPSDNPGQGGGRDERVPVTICHATHSNSNPFVTETVDDDSVDGIGEGNGQNADHNRDDHQDGEDIIPPGAWDADGRNWDATGQGIWNNNCNVPSASVDPSASPSADPISNLAVDPTLTIDGMHCDSTTFDAWIELSQNGSPAVGVPVTFTYRGTSKDATTGADGKAKVTFGFLGKDTVTADPADPFDTVSGEVKAADQCESHGGSFDPGTGGQVLGASTSSGQVLGASTLASTGAFEQTATSLMFTLAAAMIWVGVKLHGTKGQR